MKSGTGSKKLYQNITTLESRSPQSLDFTGLADLICTKMFIRTPYGYNIIVKYLIAF